MFEEISLDKKYALDEVSRQELLVARHFGHVEEQVRSVSSREKAVKITEHVMEAFERECYSEILPDVLRHYVSSLVVKYWDTPK